MNLKNKLIKEAQKKIMSSIPSKEKINNAINKIIEKAEVANGKQTVEKYNKKEDKLYMYYKQLSYSIESIIHITKSSLYNQIPLDYIDKNGAIYIVCDENNNLLYTSDYDSSLISDTETITIYDNKNNEIGNVKEKFFSLGIPLLEKEAKRCQMTLFKEKTCLIKKYVSFGELEFETEDGEFYIDYDNSNGKQEYKLKKSNTIIAKLICVPPVITNDYITKYIIEYDNIKYQSEIVLLTTMLNILR